MIICKQIMHTHIHTFQLVYMHIHTYIPSPFDIVDTVKSHNHFAQFTQRIHNTTLKLRNGDDYIVKKLKGYRDSQTASKFAKNLSRIINVLF